MKLMYLPNRHPTDYTIETFPARWRQHGHLAMKLPNWKDRNRLYMHSDLVRPLPVEGASDKYDGVGYVIFKGDPLSGAADPSKTSAHPMLEDEMLAFAGPIMPVAVFVADDVRKAGIYGGVTAFMWCNDEATAEAIADVFSGPAGAGARRVILNRILQDRPASPDPQLKYKAVVEVSAGSVEEIKALLEAPAAAAWRKADLTIIAKEAVLYNEIDAPADAAQA